MKLIARPATLEDVSTLTAIWNRACGEELMVRPRMFEYIMRTPQGVVQEGRLVFVKERAAGFVQTSIVPASSEVAPAEIGWIDSLAVDPQFRGRGLGGRLLFWAETWLKERGATKVALGGGLRPLVPGLPEELGNQRFFRQRGYGDGPETAWDMASDLGDDSKIERTVDLPGVSCCPARAIQLGELHRFLQREFPGRWCFEFVEFIREGGRPSDYMLLQGASIQGFARMTFADSERPLDRFFMHRLPQPWAQVGPIGISAARRGRGYGRVLVQAALGYLHHLGIRGCVIDWTTHPNFYRRFGFLPYRSYLLLSKQLA